MKSIPVGCVPSATVAVSVCVWGGPSGMAFWFGGLLIEGGLLVESGFLLWPSGKAFWCSVMAFWLKGVSVRRDPPYQKATKPEGHNRRPHNPPSPDQAPPETCCKTCWDRTPQKTYCNTCWDTTCNAFWDSTPTC